MAENYFDYIIAGGGMAGLSLAFYLNESILGDKKVLIIDRDSKNKNDHTWSFWEKENGAFEEIVFRRWRGVWFYGTRGFSEFLDLGEYRYKMIRAIDFYEFVLQKINLNSNFLLLQAEIRSIENEFVKTNQGEFAANEFVFDSFTRKTYDNPKYQNLWQHFRGWLVETEQNIFHPDEPTLFDFRVEQAGECRFAYILPFSESKALIEFTVFSDNLLKQGEYERNLRKYVTEILHIENFKILETEAGVIPMSDEPHDEFPAEKIIRIGAAGGYVKPSTGYSFQRTQRRLRKLVKILESSEFQVPASGSVWKNYLDSVLLNVLRTKKRAADDVFTHLFKRNPAPRVLKFLDEDTTFAEDLKIMKTVPVLAFTGAAIEEGWKKII